MYSKLPKPTICLWILIVFVASSCEKASIPREYEEIVIESPLQFIQGHVTDPHAGLQMPRTNLSAQQQTSDPSAQNILNASVTQLPLIWETPEGWEELKGSGMRLATLKTADANPIECTIVVLGGMAGGLDANVMRWMRQINLTGVPEAQFRKFMASQEKIVSQSGIPVELIDLSQLYSFGSDQHPTMIAASANVQEKTIFVKMTGNFRGVSDNKEKFKSLCRSLRLKDE